MRNITGRPKTFNLKIIFNTSKYPLWLKLLSLYLVTVFLFCLYAIAFWDVHPQLNISIYGFSTDKPSSLIGCIIIFEYLFTVFTALSILLEYKFAKAILKFYLLTAFFLCFVSMCMLPVSF